MALLPVKYQSLQWRTTEETQVDCNTPCVPEVYIDWTQPIVQAIQLSEYNGFNLLDYTYNGDIQLPIPTTRTPTLVRFSADSPYDYCYDRSTGDPYWASYTLPLDRRSANVGDIALADYLKIEFSYTSNVVFYATIHIQRNTGQSASDPVYVELPVNLGTGTVTAYIEVGANFTGYQLYLKFNSSTVDEDASFCFTDLSIKNMTTLTSNSVVFVDCYGDEENLSTDDSYYQDKLILTTEIYNQPQTGYIRILGGINPFESDPFEEASKLYSNFFTPIDPETYGYCKLNSLMKIGWTETCMYVENEEQQSIDYEFYIRGYVQRITSDLLAREYFVDSSAVGQIAFNAMVDKVEIVSNYPYPAWIHDILLRATASNTFYANDQRYRPDATNFWSMVGNQNGTYAGRTEMNIAGSETVKTLCCCPVVEPDYSGCGSLIITSVCIVGSQYRIYYELDGAVLGTSVDVQFENLSVIEESPCDVAINTTHIESSIDTIGSGYAAFSTGEWTDVFDNEYCGVTDIQYYLRIRPRCSDSIVGDWSEPLVIVPDNLQECD
jgi:hypothetical protein